MSKAPTKRTPTKGTVVMKRPTNNRKSLALKHRRPPRQPSRLHQKLIRLMTRRGGATVHDTHDAGFEYPALSALRIVEHQGYKTKVVKKPGELTRYFAKR